MSVRSVNFTYSLREGTILPGFTPTPVLLGMDKGFMAPGWDFITGSQDPNIRFRAAENDWLARSSFLTTPFSQNMQEDLNIRSNIEPLSDLKIQLDARRTSSGNYQELFRFDSDSLNAFTSLTPTRSGSYSISFLSIKTAFKRDFDQEEYNHPVFNDFVNYREIFRDRLNGINPAGEYKLNSQDVIVPAFLAAYSGKDPNKVSSSPFPRIPMPNWRVDYAGLSKIPALKEIFSAVNVTHAYQSTFNVGNYTNSLLYEDFLDLSNRITDYPLASQVTENGIVPVYIINQVAITERFSPLIGINVRTKNRLTAKIDYKRERNLSLNLANSQVTELNSSDISFDIGFTKDKFKLPFKIQGRTIVLENDLQFRMGFTIRDTKTVQRRIDDVNAITNGNINFQLRPTITYSINDKVNLTMYFDRNINEPRLTNAFRRSTTAFGAQLRFSLAQ
jgi:cell surface protein SprA